MPYLPKTAGLPTSVGQKGEVLLSVLSHELADFLQAKAASRSQGTLRFYREKLGSLIAFLENHGLESVEEVQADHVRNYLASLTSGHTLGGQHTHWRALRAFLKWCHVEYDLQADPLRNVQGPRGQSQPMQAADLDDLRAMLKVCDRRTFAGRRDDALIRCLLDTGLRASELLRLDLADVNLDNGDVRVRPEAAKTKQARVVYLGSRSLRSMVKPWSSAGRKRSGNASPRTWPTIYRTRP